MAPGESRPGTKRSLSLTSEFLNFKTRAPEQDRGDGSLGGENSSHPEERRSEKGSREDAGVAGGLYFVLLQEPQRRSRTAAHRWMSERQEDPSGPCIRHPEQEKCLSEERRGSLTGFLDSSV